MLPDDWSEALLDHVAERGSGHTPSKDVPDYWNGGIKWVSLADSSRLDKGLIKETDKEISVQGIKKSSAVIHPAGTVILSRDAGVGKSGVLASDMAVSQHFIAWNCSNSSALHNWYLYYWLQQRKAEFERIAVGSTIKTIGLPYFKKLKIQLPPLREQRQIAETLYTWDQAIATTEQLLTNGRKQFKSLLQRLLLKPAACSAWPTLPIADISERVQRQATREETLPVLMISSGSGFVRQDDKYSRFMAGKSIENYIALNRGEFAYNKGNSKLYEYGCIFPLNISDRGLVPSIYFCFKLAEDLHAGFYEHLFRADYLHEQLGARVNTGVRNNGLLNIRAADFFACKVPVPPIKEQLQISEILSAATMWIERHEQLLELLKQEKEAIMTQLLTGKRRMRLPADQNASV
ncbi:type I restriction enzyme S subunit [Xanthomonas translucens]